MLLLLVGGTGITVITVMQHQAGLNTAKSVAALLVAKSKSADKSPELGTVAQNAVGADGVTDTQGTSNASSDSSPG